MVSDDMLALYKIDAALRELRERNAIRIAAVKSAMGKKWVLHPANAPKRRRVKTVLG